MNRLFTGLLLVALTMPALGQTAKKDAQQGKRSRSAQEAALRTTMHDLWVDHAVFTRFYVVSELANLEDLQVVTDRLMKNQEELGSAIASYYGKQAGDQLTALLKEHISLSSQVVKAAEDKSPQLDALSIKWYQNGEDIAVFLSNANPNWKKAEMSKMMKTHLDLLNDMVTARLNKEWEKDLNAYEKGLQHLIMFGDMLTDGIVKQFPDKFKA